MSRAENQSSIQPPIQATDAGAVMWNVPALIAFRIGASYCCLYMLATQIIGSMLLVPGVSFRGFGLLWPFREITFWIGQSVFGLAGPLVYEGNSRDTDFYWVQAFWLLLAAVLIGAAWSIIDRNRRNYARLAQWLRC